MLNKNTWGVKKCEANQKQHCKQACATKNSDISWGQEVTLPIFNYVIEWHTIVYSIFSQVWLALSLGHLFSYLNVIKVAKWQSQSYLWKYAINYCMSFKELKIGKVTSWPQLISQFLVAHACLQCCFWLASHFFTPQVFLFSILLTHNFVGVCAYFHTCLHKKVLTSNYLLGGNAVCMGCYQGENQKTVLHYVHE